MKHRALSAAFLSFVALAAAALASPASASFTDEIESRARWNKSPRAVVAQTDERHIVYVKFLDDLPVRAVDGMLTDRATGALNPAREALNALPIARWQPVNDLPDDRLASIRATAERALRKALPDLATEFFAFLDGDADPAAVIDALNALEIVELADAQPKPVEPPLPPDFQSNQGYLTASPAGVDALHGWSTLGTRGEGVAIVDLEYIFNPDHADLPTVQIIGGPPLDPGFGSNHGTAVLGQVGALNNGWGVTGIAHGSTIAFASTYAGSVWNVGGAIINATAALSPGDIILVEQQMSGPNGGTTYVPIEWRLQWYNAVVNAVANGMIVVIAAGNGSQNLDDPIFSTGNGGHWPFLPENDSGSIIVGAGAAAAGFNNSTTPRSRLSFSTYGSRVNLQGWGERVWTTGYGSAFWSMGPNYEYTGTFGGTSSASPIVAGACALIQSLYKATNPGQTLTSWEMRALLVSTGAPQQSGMNPLNQNIGPLPDLTAASVKFHPHIVAIDKIHPESRLSPTRAHILDRATNYGSFLSQGSTVLHRTGSDSQWVFLLGDYNGDRISDLYAINRMNAAGTTLHVLDGASNYQQFLTHRITGLPQTGNDGSWNFGLGDYNGDGVLDLYAFNKQGASGSTEVHILGGAGHFQNFLMQTATVLHPTGTSHQWVLLVGDYNRDGKPDIYAVNRMNAAGTTLHVINGADNFQSFLLHRVTGLHQSGTDGGWNFGLGDFNGDGVLDLFTMNKQGSSGFTQVHVLGGASQFLNFIEHRITTLPQVGNDHSWVLLVDRRPN